MIPHYCLATYFLLFIPIFVRQPPVWYLTIVRSHPAQYWSFPLVSINTFLAQSIPLPAHSCIPFLRSVTLPLPITSFGFQALFVRPLLNPLSFGHGINLPELTMAACRFTSAIAARHEGCSHPKGSTRCRSKHIPSRTITWPYVNSFFSLGHLCYFIYASILSSSRFMYLIMFVRVSL